MFEILLKILFLSRAIFIISIVSVKDIQASAESTGQEKQTSTEDDFSYGDEKKDENIVFLSQNQSNENVGLKADASQFINEERGFDLSSAEMEKFKIWRNGVIPYFIDVVSFSDKVLRDNIRNFLQVVNAATGVKFEELPGPPSDDRQRWIFFINRRGLLDCADHSVKNFSNQGVQQVILGYDCMATKGELAETVMSILGVPAQHNAPDRDQYIEINIDNILPDKKDLFQKLNDNEWLFHDLPYDFESATHYDLYKYSANGRATITLKNNNKDFSSATSLSQLDLKKIKMLYRYIIDSNQMTPSLCQKMFKLRKSRPSNIGDKIPLGKPNRYLGVAGEQREKLNELDYIEKAENKNNNYEEDKHNNNEEDKNSNNEEDKNNNNEENKDNKNEEDKHNNNEEYVNNNDHQASDENNAKVDDEERTGDNINTEGDFHESKKKYKSDRDFRPVALKGNADLLNLLSDYQTDERK